MELIVFVSMVSEVALSMEVFPMPPEMSANAVCVTWASPNPSWYPSCMSNGSMVTLRAVEPDGEKILDRWVLIVCHKERCDSTSSYWTHWQDKSFGLYVRQTTGLMDCLPWWCHGFNNQRLCLQIQYCLLSMSKSVPLEQMVLEAGEQPFSHLSLDSRTHHSAWAGEEGVCCGQNRWIYKKKKQPCETLQWCLICRYANRKFMSVHISCTFRMVIWGEATPPNTHPPYNFSGCHMPNETAI